MKKILRGLSFTVLLLYSTLVSADCLDLERFTSWVVEDTHTIVFYAGVKPIARLEIPNCEIQPTSKIRLIRSYVCDSDEIEIDGEACRMISVEVLY
jgi:hypothetical protein